MKLQSLTQECCQPARFFGGSDTRIIMSWEEAALIRVWDEQNMQMKSAKSSTAQTPRLQPTRGKYLRASHRQGQGAAKLTMFMSGISFTKVCAIFSHKLYARFSDHAFDQGNGVLAFRRATNLDVRGWISMKTDRFRQVPNRLIQSSTRPSELVHLSQARIADVACSKVTGQLPISSNQGGSSEL